MIWREVSGYDGRYEVSDGGQVRSQYFGEWRLLRQRLNRYGYPQVNLKSHQKGNSATVHSLVATAFIGPRPHGLCVNHKDGFKPNNKLSNLEYVTPLENTSHATKLGLMLRGERNAAARLSEEEVRQIRSLYIFGSHEAGTRAIARQFGMSQYAIHRIVSGQTWTHI